jgi:hypothetical protein
MSELDEIRAERDELRRQLYRCSGELDVLLAGEQTDGQVAKLKAISVMTDAEVGAAIETRKGGAR